MILEYVKGFLTLFLLIKVLLYFVPKNAFEKYIAFFSGVILVIGMLYPLLEAYGQGDVILKKLQYGKWEEQLLEISINAEQLEEEGRTLFEEKYLEVMEESAQAGEEDE